MMNYECRIEKVLRDKGTKAQRHRDLKALRHKVLSRQTYWSIKLTISSWSTVRPEGSCFLKISHIRSKWQGWCEMTKPSWSKTFQYLKIEILYFPQLSFCILHSTFWILNLNYLSLEPSEPTEPLILVSFVLCASVPLYLCAFVTLCLM